jgi:hypothetical protein
MSPLKIAEAFKGRPGDAFMRKPCDLHDVHRSSGCVRETARAAAGTGRFSAGSRSHRVVAVSHPGTFTVNHQRQGN